MSRYAIKRAAWCLPLPNDYHSCLARCVSPSRSLLRIPLGHVFLASYSYPFGKYPRGPGGRQPPERAKRDEFFTSGQASPPTNALVSPRRTMASRTLPRDLLALQGDSFPGRSAEKMRTEHLSRHLPAGLPPSGGPCIGFRTEPSLAFTVGDHRLGVIFLPRHMVDLLATIIRDVSLDVAGWIIQLVRHERIPSGGQEDGGRTADDENCELAHDVTIAGHNFRLLPAITKFLGNRRYLPS